MKKAIITILGILMVPLCISATRALYGQLGMVKVSGSVSYYFSAGLLSYLLFHLFFYVPQKIFDSEQRGLNAAVKWLSAGKVQQVDTKAALPEDQIKPAATLTLWPHFVPLYVILCGAIYFFLSLFFDVDKYVGIFFFFTGVGLALHMVFTAQMIKAKYKNLLVSAYLLTITIVYLFNIIVLVVVLKYLFKTPSVGDFFIATYTGVKSVYLGIFRQLFGT